MCHPYRDLPFAHRLPADVAERIRATAHPFAAVVHPQRRVRLAPRERPLP